MTTVIPQIQKADWPEFIADQLEIPTVYGTQSAWMSNGDTPIIEWFIKVGDRLGLPRSNQRKTDQMRRLLQRVGVPYDSLRHDSSATPSGGGENVRKEAFEDFYAGLVKHGHVQAAANTFTRPPNWSWDEQVLAFELYLRGGEVQIDKSDPRVLELSQLLRSSNIHGYDLSNSKYRSASSVARKVADIHTHRPTYTGKKTSGSKLDEKIWEHFGSSPDREAVFAYAGLIREAMNGLLVPEPDEMDVEELHDEGVMLYRRHRVYERDPKLRKRKLASVFKKFDVLKCEVCHLVPANKYGEEFKDVLECHHLEPLSSTGPRKTSINDLALLCATCHRIAHRIKPAPTLEALQRIVKP